MKEVIRQIRSDMPDAALPVRGKNAAAYCRGFRLVRRGMPEAVRRVFFAWLQDKMFGACVPLKVCVMDAETS